MVMAPLSSKVVERFGARWVIASGLTIVAAGPGAWRPPSAPTRPTLLLAVCLVILATGMAMTMAPATTSIMTSLPLGKAGVGSAVNDTTRELGGALGVAVLGSLVASHYASSIGDVPGFAGAVGRGRPAVARRRPPGGGVGRRAAVPQLARGGPGGVRRRHGARLPGGGGGGAGGGGDGRPLHARPQRPPGHPRRRPRCRLEPAAPAPAPAAAEVAPDARPGRPRS